MPTEHVGFFPSMVLIYSKQFSNAISETTEIYFIFFFFVKRRRIIYMPDIFKDTTEKCLI